MGHTLGWLPGKARLRLLMAASMAGCRELTVAGQAPPRVWEMEALAHTNLRPANEGAAKTRGNQ